MSYRPPKSLLPLLAPLPRRLYAHIALVVAEADGLAASHRIDVERAREAAWAHDIARAMPPEELLRLADDYGLNLLEEERAAPLLLHGPVGAEILRRRAGWNDEEMLNAVRYHTTGRPEMSPFEMLILLADKIEPAKLTDEGMKRVRAATLEDLVAGARLFYSWHESNNRRLGRVTHPLASKTSRWLGSTGNSRVDRER